MEDNRDALLVIGDAEAEGTVALDLERLPGQHAARIYGVHVREQQDFLGAGAGERRAYHLANLRGRVEHLVNLGSGLDQLHLGAQLL